MARESNVSPSNKGETSAYSDPFIEAFEREQNQRHLSETKHNTRRRAKRAHRCRDCSAVFSGIGSRWTAKEHELWTGHKVGAIA